MLFLSADKRNILQKKYKLNEWNCPYAYSTNTTLNDAAPYKSIRLTVTMMTSDDDNDECSTNITMKQ